MTWYVNPVPNIGDTWDITEKFDTKEEAIEYGIQEYKDHLAGISTEIAEDWLRWDTITKEQLEELQDNMQKMFDEWLKKPLNLHFITSSTLKKLMRKIMCSSDMRDFMKHSVLSNWKPGDYI